MAAGWLLYQLVPALRRRCSSRAFSSAAAARQSHREAAKPAALTGKVDRFGGVTVDLATCLPEDIGESCFSALLKGSVARWKEEGKVAVWLQVPIALSRCAAAAAAHGFVFHHARERHAVLALWVGAGPSRLPGFATHQVGVAGAVVDESNGKVLVVQDRNKTMNAWKFPGGLSDPGENIGVTAVREVLEETGVRSEFRSLLSIRQQHQHPGAFGVSALRVAGPGPAGPHRPDHAHHVPRGPAAASRPGARLPAHRPRRRGAAGRLLGDVLPALPPTASSVSGLLVRDWTRLFWLAVHSH